MLEWSARHGWREPEEALYRDLLRRERLEATREELDRARGMVAAWLASGLCEELRASGARLRPEMPFILPLGGSVVRGTIDLYADEAGLPLVVDYKTDALGDRSVEELVDRYGVQRSIYALAAAGETQRVRTAYVFLERAGEPVELELDAVALAASRQRARGADRGHRGGALRGHPRAARGALLGLSCPRPSLLTPEGADRPPAMTRVAVFAYGSLASLASAERTLERPVPHAGRARLAGWRRRWSHGARQPPLREDLRPRRRRHRAAPLPRPQRRAAKPAPAPTGC